MLRLSHKLALNMMTTREKMVEALNRAASPLARAIASLCDYKLA